MFRIANHYVSKIVFVLLFVELLILLGAAYAGAAMRFLDIGVPLTASQFDHFPASAAAFAVAVSFSMSAMGMYQLDFDEQQDEYDLRHVVIRNPEHASLRNTL